MDKTASYLKIGAYFLVAYPAICFVSIMMLSGPGTSSSRPLVLLSQTLWWGIAAYPVVYIPCRILAERSDEGDAYRYSSLPIFYLRALGILFLTVLVLAEGF